MTQLLLIRHGQAGDIAGEYDRLSSLGKDQARRCGELWRAHLDLAALWRGDMRRHVETMDAFARAFDGPPAVEVDDAFNEFDHEDILAVQLPQLAAPEGRLSWLQEQEHPGRALDQLFHDAIGRWSSGAHDGDYRESFPSFRARVLAGFERAAARLERGQTGVVVTSGGAIAIVVSQLLGIPDARSLDLCWSFVNAGVTQVRLDARRRVGFFNDHHHLRTEPGLVTWR